MLHLSRALDYYLSVHLISTLFFRDIQGNVYNLRHSDVRLDRTVVRTGKRTSYILSRTVKVWRTWGTRAPCSPTDAQLYISLARVPITGTCAAILKKMKTKRLAVKPSGEPLGKGENQIPKIFVSRPAHPSPPWQTR